MSYPGQISLLSLSIKEILQTQCSSVRQPTVCAGIHHGPFGSSLCDLGGGKGGTCTTNGSKLEALAATLP